MARARPSKPHLEVIRSDRVTVAYERDSLAVEDATAFAALAAQGLHELERLAGRAGGARLRFELSGGTSISTTRGRAIRLSTQRVASRSAPYLHEITHGLFPCPHAPPWFSEGLACFLEALVSERGRGYDPHLFSSSGNQGVDADAARWLADPRGQNVLRFVGARGMPRNIVADRHGVAAPFYVLSHSLVKFIADQAGTNSLFRLARDRAFALSLRRLTGRAASSLRSDWLARVAQASSLAITS